MEHHRQREGQNRSDFLVSFRSVFFLCGGEFPLIETHAFFHLTQKAVLRPVQPLHHDRRCPASGFGTFSNNPEKLSLFGGGCNENDRVLDLYGGL